MIPILNTVLGPVLDTILKKVTDQLPVTENEKENIRIRAEKELAQHAGEIAEAEAALSNNAKEAWLAELHNGGFLATTWRPLLALCSTIIMVWDGIIVNIVNAALKAMEWAAIANTPDAVLQVAMWILLTLIGARGVEKIAVVRNKK